MDALPWYFPSVIFLASLCLVLICLTFIYKFIGSILALNKREEADDTKEKGIDSEALVSLSLKSKHLIEEISDIDAGSVKLEIELRYVKNRSHLSGVIRNINGLPGHDEGGPIRIRFHIMFKTKKKKRKRETQSILADSADKIIPWEFMNTSENDFSASLLRFRLYGLPARKRAAFGKGICYGELYLNFKNNILDEHGVIIAGELSPLTDSGSN